MDTKLHELGKDLTKIADGCRDHAPELSRALDRLGHTAMGDAALLHEPVPLLPAELAALDLDRFGDYSPRRLPEPEAQAEYDRALSRLRRQRDRTKR